MKLSWRGFALFILYLLSASVATGQTTVRAALPRDLTIENHLYILDVETSGPPVLVENRKEVIFTFTPVSNQQVVRSQGYQNQLSLASSAPSRVSIAFGHEQYRVLHPMDRSPKGVYFYFFEYTRSFLEEHRNLEYRYIVDGVWMDDPLNPMTRSLISGARLSMVPLPPAPMVPDATPILMPPGAGLEGRTVRFVYEAPPGKEVYLAGSFNAWDPFLHRLRERPDVPGVYEITLHLSPGVYHYQYVSGGRRSLDPLNPSHGQDSEGISYSRVTIPR